MTPTGITPFVCHHTLCTHTLDPPHAHSFGHLVSILSDVALQEAFGYFRQQHAALGPLLATAACQMYLWTHTEQHLPAAAPAGQQLAHASLLPAQPATAPAAGQGAAPAAAAAAAAAVAAGASSAAVVSIDSVQQALAKGRAKETKTKFADGARVWSLCHAWQLSPASRAGTTYTPQQRCCGDLSVGFGAMRHTGRFKDEGRHQQRLAVMADRCAALFDGAIRGCFQVGGRGGCVGQPKHDARPALQVAGLSFHRRGRLHSVPCAARVSVSAACRSSTTSA
jgi:hypothetical protein